MSSLHLLPRDQVLAVTWCAVSERTPYWPFNAKCERPVIGKLSEQDYELLVNEFPLRSEHRHVCQFHADQMDAYLTAVLE